MIYHNDPDLDDLPSPDTWEESHQIWYIKRSFKNIGAFTNPSLTLQLVALQTFPESIAYIVNPPPMIQWMALKHHPALINLIHPVDSIDHSLRIKYGDYLYRKSDK